MGSQSTTANNRLKRKPTTFMIAASLVPQITIEMTHEVTEDSNPEKRESKTIAKCLAWPRSFIARAISPL